MTTVENVVALKPEFVRLYPALVIKDTPLAEFYRTGRYTPLPLDDAVSLCRDALVRFEQANIEVIRIGLQTTEELEKPGTILAGPYHPRSGSLWSLLCCWTNEILFIRQERENRYRPLPGQSSRPVRCVSQRRSNIDLLKRNSTAGALHGSGTTLKRREPVLFASAV
jgi:hypothetical protein